jgi:glucokinase
MLIAGDTGGTKTELAIFSNEGGPHSPLAQVKVHSADYPSLEAIVKEFLAKVDKPVDRACFAVPGPVIGGRVKTTNLPWMIEDISLARELNLNIKSVYLINDLEAVARAVPILRPSDVVTINRGESVPRGAIAVIAPGTGLGESFLTWDGSRHLAHSSEGGHADFAPTDERQIRLLQYMLKKFDHVSFEHVCSGIGIPLLYDYLRDVERIPETPEVAERIASSSDPSVAIINQALSSANASKLCADTIDLFVSILANEAANLALKVLATGGVYVAGGVVVHTLVALQRPGFMQSFKRKGRFAELMARIPIHVVVSHAALAGAAAYGLGNGVEHFESQLTSQLHA